MDIQFVYVNCPNAEEAKAIAKRLVSEKWAASASIQDGTISYYYWEGELKEDKETTLVLQCRTSDLKQVCEIIKAMHSYEVPCIMSWPLTGGEPSFIDWMQRVMPETRQASNK